MSDRVAVACCARGSACVCVSGGGLKYQSQQRTSLHNKTNMVVADADISNERCSFWLCYIAFQPQILCFMMHMHVHPSITPSHTCCQLPKLHQWTCCQTHNQSKQVELRPNCVLYTAPQQLRAVTGWCQAAPQTIARRCETLLDKYTTH